MTKRIFRSILFMTVGVLLAVLILVIGVLYSNFQQVQKTQLRMQTELAAQGVTHEQMTYLEGLSTEDYRITWISADGNILYDSYDQTGENHLDREEVQQALTDGYGESSRYSQTTLEHSLYAAQKLDDGTVIRLSMSQASVAGLVLGVLHPVVIVLIVAVAGSYLLAVHLSNRIVKPLNALNPEDPQLQTEYEELAPLIGRIHAQQRQLSWQRTQLQRRQEQWQTVTGNMSEGLILLDAQGKVLSINPSAARLLDAYHFMMGDAIDQISHSPELAQLLEKTHDGQPAEQILTLKGERYQCDVTPILAGGQVEGMVILLINVTEKERLELMRREFTANVSHELKTPLHSISGYAELMEANMVRQEDIVPFAKKIRKEAGRMMRLVEDILNLSRLEESAQTMAAVDVYTVAARVVDDLRLSAQNAGVTVKLEGGPVTVWGVDTVLYSIVYNLCTNAITYNHPNGLVTIQVRENEEQAILQVSDTGIGIAPEHQGRIFERFYRVDKSHSKEMGGTGLGLSIVKHGVRLHQGRIDLRSQPGEGTIVAVYLSKSSQ